MEICVECGKSVTMGSGRFINRIPVIEPESDRPYPKGKYICELCDLTPA